MRKRALSIGIVLALAGALAWLGTTQQRAAAPQQPLPNESRDQVAQAPVRSAGPAPNSAEPPRNAAPAVREPSPSQALSDVQALVDQGKVGAARDLAELYLARIPSGPEAARIESLTGVHPHR
jgi:hypothetical protein